MVKKKFPNKKNRYISPNVKKRKFKIIYNSPSNNQNVENFDMLLAIMHEN